jgi:16S rRNA (cytosine1402-N4)-methyltransferase
VTDASHVPVLLDRVVALVAPALDRPEQERTLMIDATLGLGGHTEAVLERCPQAHVIGIDRDVHALDRSRERLAPYGERVTFVHAVYDEIADVLDELGHPYVDGVLFDLGVSSMQLDLRERGFAYSQDAPLDMRMDDTGGPTAADVLNEYPVEELTRVLKHYGEERFARRIAEAVVRERTKEPFTTSGRLVELLYDSIPAPARRTGGHPAKRTFQALRIGVGGRVVVMSYHSLEDRITKQVFARVTRNDLPPDLPFVPEGHEPALRLVTRGSGSEKASPAEIEANPRAASVRLRAVERVHAGAVA